MEESRNYNMDLMKGVLILAVIIGHVIQGSLETSIARYLIYSFHMPLFFAASGYLLNIHKLKELSLMGLIKKYWGRLIVPWIIANNVYFFINHYSSFKTEGFTGMLYPYLRSYWRPFYHLWFVLGFMFCIFLTWACLKLNISWNSILGFALAVSVFFKFGESLFDFLGGGAKKIWGVLDGSFRLYNYIFLILGICVRQNHFINEEKVYKNCCKGAAVFGAITVLLFFPYNLLSIKVIFFFLNIPLAIAVLIACQNRIFQRNRILEYIGRNSYAFYLWHMLARLYTEYLVGKEDLMLFYIVNLVLFIVEGILIFMLSKNRFIRKYFLGAI